MTTTFWQRLLYRWFVQYNPLYLVSAAFVLIGVSVSSSALAQSSSGGIAVTAISELYAWALIGGAAFLMRVELRRPAVMLALLTALYQCDPTLHSETCAYLGSTGALATAAWLASFAGKLQALAWAMRIRLSTSARLVALSGAFGIAALPRVFLQLDASTSTSLLTAWLFTLFALAGWSTRAVDSRVPLDAWGRAVLRRAVSATWALWGVLSLSHVVFLAGELGLKLGGLLPMALLLSTRCMQRELSVWVTVAITLLIGTAMPASFSITALMAAAVLALRALRQPSYMPVSPEAPSRAAPYRSIDDLPRSSRPELVWFGVAAPRAMARLFAGTATGVYLSLWTWGWSGGRWPDHPIWLDAGLTLVLVLLIWRARVRSAAILPLVATHVHRALQTGLIVAPATRLGWGLSSVAVGFGLLLISLLMSWRFRRGLPETDLE